MVIKGVELICLFGYDLLFVVFDIDRWNIVDFIKESVVVVINFVIDCDCEIEYFFICIVFGECLSLLSGVKWLFVVEMFLLIILEGSVV